MILHIHERAGRCRWCGCTDDHACDAACSWANVKHTLCSECVDFDRLIRSKAGREVLVHTDRDVVQELKGLR